MSMHDNSLKVELANSLACVLASAYTLQLKVHGFHWNVKGKDFTEFHKFFGMLQDDIYGMIDGTAENILKLGFDAPGSLSEMLALSCIEDGSVHVGEPIDMTMQFLAANEMMLEAINATFQLATVANEQGIADFMAQRDDMHKKWAWQARAIAGLQPSRLLGKADAGFQESAVVTMIPQQEIQLAAAPCCASACMCTLSECACGEDCMCSCKKKKKMITASANKDARKVLFSKEAELAIKQVADAHNKKAVPSRRADLTVLRTVYRRGANDNAGMLSNAKSLHEHSMSRVNAFLRLLSSGESAALGYTADNDLLPRTHPKSTNKNAAMTAASVADKEMYVAIRDEKEYSGTNEALVAMAEYSGLGYEIIPSLKAAWARGVRNNENGFARAKNLSVFLYDSKDADLLPLRKVDTL